MFKFNSQCIPDSRQCPIDGVKEVIATCIVLRSDPFGLHYPPQGFRKVQVRGIRRKVKEEKPTFLPQCSQFPYFLVPMYARIVKHDKRTNPYIQRKEMVNHLNIHESCIKRRLVSLQEKGIIKHIGPNKGGYWELINSCS